MKLHKRHFIVQTARGEIAKAILDAEQQHDLTYAELVGILAEELQSLTKYAIREERHGDASKPGDAAFDEDGHEP